MSYIEFAKSMGKECHYFSIARQKLCVCPISHVYFYRILSLLLRINDYKARIEKNEISKYLYLCILLLLFWFFRIRTNWIFRIHVLDCMLMSQIPREIVHYSCRVESHSHFIISFTFHIFILRFAFCLYLFFQA